MVSLLLTSVKQAARSVKFMGAPPSGVVNRGKVTQVFVFAAVLVLLGVCEAREKVPSAATLDSDAELRITRRVILNRAVSVGLEDSDLQQDTLSGICERLNQSIAATTGVTCIRHRTRYDHRMEEVRGPASVKRLQPRTSSASNKGKFGGLGILIGISEAPVEWAWPDGGESIESYVVIIKKVMPDTPAAAANLDAGDWICAVDATPLSNADVAGAVKALRGNVGSPVKLFVRKKAGHFEQISVTRDVIRVPWVSVRELGNSIRLLRFSYIHDSLLEPLRIALTRAAADQVSGLILDLRGGLGWDLRTVKSVVSMFVGPGTPLYQADTGRDDDVHRVVSSGTVTYLLWSAGVLG